MNKELLRTYKVDKTSETRKAFDFYPSPAIATYVLYKNHDLPKTILEPCAGRGHIAKILDILGYEVTAFDLEEHPEPYVPIITGYDFLELPRQEAEGVITNPPYMKKLPEQFIEKILGPDEYKFCAFLCRSNFMESLGRYHLFQKYPPTKVLVFSDRITHDCHDLFDIDNNFRGMVCYAWYIWDYRTTKPEDTKTQLDFILAKSYKDELKELLNNEL